MEEQGPFITRSAAGWQWRAQHALDSVRPSGRQSEGKKLSFEQIVGCVSLFLAAFVTFIIYHQAGKAGFIKHLPSGIRHVLLNGTAVFSFVITAILATTKVSRFLMGIGIVMFIAVLIFRLA